MPTVAEFWAEIEHLKYASAVWDYKENDFAKILQKYGLKRTCPCCGQGVK